MVNTLSEKNITNNKKKNNEETLLSLTDLLTTENADKETLEVIVERMEKYITGFYPQSLEKITPHLKGLGYEACKVVKSTDLNIKTLIGKTIWDTTFSDTNTEFRFFARKPSKREYQQMLIYSWQNDKNAESHYPDLDTVKVPEDYYDMITIDFTEKSSGQHVEVKFERDDMIRSPEKYTLKAHYHKQNFGGGPINTSQVLEKLRILLNKMEGKPNE